MVYFVLADKPVDGRPDSRTTGDKVLSTAPKAPPRRCTFMKSVGRDG